MKQSVLVAVFGLLLASVLEATPDKTFPEGVTLSPNSGKQLTLTKEATDCLDLIVTKIKIIRGNRTYDLPLWADSKPAAQDHFDIDYTALTDFQIYDTKWVLENILQTTHQLRYEEVVVANHHFIRVWPTVTRDVRIKND
jgi:hypothetical protein